MLKIRATDHLDPMDRDRPIWKIDDPAVYGRRMPATFVPNSSEAMNATGVFDLYAYFRDRRDFLRDHIAKLRESAKVLGDRGAHCVSRRQGSDRWHRRRSCWDPRQSTSSRLAQQ
ncbi:MAG: hypothetical protein M3256_03265, partial [Actinomycetota bacterium]|nr:hypothetical protein [Actinomycetota bacterium]